MSVILPKANAKAAALPLAVVAVAVVQLGSAFLAIAVQQSSGPGLTRFLDGIVVLTIVWAVIVLIDLLAFPDTSTTAVVVSRALAVAGAVTAFHIIFRAAEGIMGHSLGLRYAIGQIGYTGTLVWGWASLWFLGSQKYRERTESSTPKASKATTAAEEAPATIIDVTAEAQAEAAANKPSRSAFSALLGDDAPDLD